MDNISIFMLVPSDLRHKKYYKIRCIRLGFWGHLLLFKHFKERKNMFPNDQNTLQQQTK